MVNKQDATNELKTTSENEDFLYNFYHKKVSSLKSYRLTDMSKKQKWEMCCQLLLARTLDDIPVEHELPEVLEELTISEGDRSWFTFIHTLNVLICSSPSIAMVTRIMDVCFSKLQMNGGAIMKEDELDRIDELMEELQCFLISCHMKYESLTQTEETTKPLYQDLLVALLSWYVDLVCRRNRSVAENSAVGAQLCGFCWYMLLPWPNLRLDLLLQLTIYDSQDQQSQMPLIRKCLEKLPETADYMHYVKYILLIKEMSEYFGGSMSDLIQNARKLAAPKGFIKWLKKSCPAILDNMPDDRKFKKRQVTQFLLNDCPNVVYEQLSDLLSEDKIATCTDGDHVNSHEDVDDVEQPGDLAAVEADGRPTEPMKGNISNHDEDSAARDNADKNDQSIEVYFIDTTANSNDRMHAQVELDSADQSSKNAQADEGYYIDTTGDKSIETEIMPTVDTTDGFSETSAIHVDSDDSQSSDSDIFSNKPKQMITRRKEKLGNIDLNPVVELTSIPSPLKRKTSTKQQTTGNIGGTTREIIEDDTNMKKNNGSPSKRSKNLNPEEIVENSHESEDESVDWTQTPDISVHSKMVEDMQDSMSVADKKKNSSETTPLKFGTKSPKAGYEITHTKQGSICTRLRTRENTKRKDITLFESSKSTAPDSAGVTEDVFNFKSDSEARSPALRRKIPFTNRYNSLKKDYKFRGHSVHTDRACPKEEAASEKINDVAKKLPDHQTSNNVVRPTKSGHYLRNMDIDSCQSSTISSDNVDSRLRPKHFDKDYYPTDESDTTAVDSECDSVVFPIASRTRNASGRWISLSSEISAPPIQTLFADSCSGFEKSSDDFTKQAQPKDIKTYSSSKVRKISENSSDEDIDFTRLMSAKIVGDVVSPNKNLKNPSGKMASTSTRKT